MSALYIGIIIIGFLLVLIGSIIALVRLMFGEKKRGPWIWYVACVIGLAYIITGIVLYVLNPTHSGLITRDASELVLTINDFEPGSVQLESEVVNKESAQSAYYVYFYIKINEERCCYDSYMKNTVAVYHSINSAKMMYLDAKPTNISLEYPKIGDECFLNILNNLLVFRKNNVVVWVQLQQDSDVCSNMQSYAKIIEKRIS